MEQSRRIAGSNLAFQYEIKRNPYLIDYERERNRRMEKRREPQCAADHSVEQIGVRRPQGAQVYQGQRRPQGAQVTPPARSAASRRRKRTQMHKAVLTMGVMLVAVLGIYLFAKGGQANAAENGQSYGIWQGLSGNGSRSGQTKVPDTQGLSEEVFAKHPEWTENFLTPNEYSRPGEPLTEIKSVFVHYTANPGTSAAQNRSYFERQKDEHQASVSAHFIIGYEGEIIQCVPLNEIAYAVKSRNYDSVSIECCHMAEDGSFTQETYDSLIALLAWLTESYGLDTDDILRHYDCGGKLCPLYYTEHEDEWEQLKQDVSAKMAAKQ